MGVREGSGVSQHGRPTDEQDIARRLQHSLLPGTPPGGDGLEVEVIYRPAEAGLEVGGDWYDAFWLDDGDRAGLVVGDVVGRGIDAAATMGQLRSAVRALAATGLGPAGLLSALDGYARRHDVGQMATLIYAELSLSRRRLCLACAGHPPPLLVPLEDDPFLIWAGRSLPLDAHGLGSGARAQEEVAVPAGSTLLFYTDGLVESRSRPLDTGLERLVEVARGHPGEPPRMLAQAILDGVRDVEHPDDVCLLAVRVG